MKQDIQQVLSELCDERLNKWFYREGSAPAPLRSWVFEYNDTDTNLSFVDWVWSQDLVSYQFGMGYILEKG
jgi:hypothetical protein